MKRVLIVPAAGRGSRLQSTVPKVLYPVLGRPMIDFILDLYRPHVDRIVLVLHPSFEEDVRRHCKSRSIEVDVVLQPTPDGMLPAMLLPKTVVESHRPDHVWVSWCDMIAIQPATLLTMKQLSESDPGVSLIFPTAKRKDPYIHFPRDSEGRITGVLHRRENDVMPPIGETDAGVFCLSADAYLVKLSQFSKQAVPSTGTREKNFLPFIPWLARTDTVRTFPLPQELESIGVNDTHDLKKLEAFLRGAI